VKAITAKHVGKATRTIVSVAHLPIPIVIVCIISKIGVSIGAKVAMSMKVHTAKIATNTIVMSVKGARVAVAIE
jgi:hypothetical protein